MKLFKNIYACNLTRNIKGTPKPRREREREGNNNNLGQCFSSICNDLDIMYNFWKSNRLYLIWYKILITIIRVNNILISMRKFYVKK